MNDRAPRTQLINISEPIITNFRIPAKIIAILPEHLFPLVVATDARKPDELRCFDVFGNPANNSGFVIYNTSDRDAPTPREDYDADSAVQRSGTQTET